MNRLKYLVASVIGLAMCMLQIHYSIAQDGRPQAFATPEQAVAELIKSAKSDDPGAILKILGNGSRELVESGDPIDDANGRKRFVAAYETKHAIQSEGPNRAVLLLGNDDFPFPIPVIKLGDQWSFDIAEGKEEILNRRVGRNELNIIQTLLAIADAQFEFAELQLTSKTVKEYAPKFVSSEGKKDGLYWPVRDDNLQSPLGPLVANAVRAGYKPTARPAQQPAQPYHGYHFKMLLAQGNSAPGGAHPYVVQGRMIGGFAVIAYPATYGNSGVKTFMISHDRIVFEVDFGEETLKIAEVIRTFDPTSSWTIADTGN